jgi:hypothetical protein
MAQQDDDFAASVDDESTALLADYERQRTDLLFQWLIARARAPEERVALLGRALEHGLEEAIELFPAIQVHRRFHH